MKITNVTLLIVLISCAIVSILQAAPLDYEIEIADAIFITSFNPQGNPQLKVEKTLFQKDSILGEAALHQAEADLLERFTNSFFPIKERRSDIVFSRLPKGDFFNIPFSVFSNYQITNGRFSISDHVYSLSDAREGIKLRK